MGEMNVFSGMIYCADCGKKMYLYYVSADLGGLLGELTNGFDILEFSLTSALAEFDSFVVEETDENGITVNKLEFGMDINATDGSVKVKL